MPVMLTQWEISRRRRLVNMGFVLRIRLQLINGQEHCRGRQWHMIAILGHIGHPSGIIVSSLVGPRISLLIQHRNLLQLPLKRAFYFVEQLEYCPGFLQK